MNLSKAIKVLSKYWPCTHESYEVVGTGNVWGKCEDCGLSFPLASLPKLQESGKEFGEAVDCLNSMTPLVNPIPQTEEVEVKKWVNLDDKGGITGIYPSHLDADMWAHQDRAVCVELTGHYSRPVKKKVKRREEIPSDAVDWGQKCELDRLGKMKYYREWEE
jgi:hypothetical protein